MTISLKPTKRDTIFERFFNQQQNYRYFYFEEDYMTEDDVELFGYSKFTCDAAYDDEEVNWNYIIGDGRIFGIIALKNEDENLKIKFLEIKETLKNRGLGTQTIEFLKDAYYGKANSIILYPKNKEVAEGFYKPLGFKDYGKEELVYSL